jgi:hypothetical protein
MSAAERVVGGVGVDADDATRDDGVDVALVSSPSHIVEQVEGVTEMRFLSSVAGAAAGSGIPLMGAALLWIRGAVEVAVAEQPTSVDDAAHMEAVVNLVVEMPCEEVMEVAAEVGVAVAGSPEAAPLGARTAARARAR